MTAQNKVARIAGGSYLAFILTSVLADRLGHIGLGSAQQVYQAVVTDPSSFRLALVVGLVSAFLFLVTAWGLYVLLRPVNKHLALLFLLLNTVGVAIQCASMFPLLSALLTGDAGSHMQAYSAAQLEGLSYLSINVYKTGFVTAQLFFGTWLFPLGYLVYKSGYLPRFLGVLLRPVNEHLALLFLLLNAVGVAIQCASMFPLLSALLMGDAGSHMQAYSAAQLEGLGYLSINVYKAGFVTAQLFFGTWLFPLGYLVYKSGYLPRLLGVLLLLDGIAVLIWFFQALVLPDNPAIHSPGLVVSLVAEVGLTLWLLVMGVKVVDPGAPSLVHPSPAS